MRWPVGQINDLVTEKVGRPLTVSRMLTHLKCVNTNLKLYVGVRKVLFEV